MGRNTDNNALTPARASLSTTLRRDCAVCANPVNFGTVNDTDETHCRGEKNAQLFIEN